MKLQNHKFARTLAAAAVATCAVAMLSVGAFAADVAIGEKDHLRRLRCPGRPCHPGQHHAHQCRR